MNKDVFLQKLSGYLKKLSKAEKEDILSDFEEYFTFAVQEGEDEQAVCARLGDPKKIAKEYYSQKMIEEANNQKSFKSMSRAFAASAGLSIINFFYVLCVVVVGYIVIASLYIAACATGLSAVLALVGSVVMFGMTGPLTGWISIMLSIGLIALAVLGFIGIMQLTKLFSRGNMNFLNMTNRGIKRGAQNE